ncbi:MAG TPA: DUF4249 family protein [Bacteroidales bacterium]
MKNIKNKLKLALYIFPAIFITACEEPIEDKLDSTYTRLVVDGTITTDTMAHRVLLKYSNDALNRNPIRFVSGAVVTISDGTNTFNLHENPKVPGEYLTDSNVYGVPGNTYTLNISNVDVDDNGVKETYTASSYLPYMSRIDTITVTDYIYNDELLGWLINLYGQDRGGRNYYLTKAIRNDTLVTDSLKEYGAAVNSVFEGEKYEGFAVYFLEKDDTTDIVRENDRITLELNCITKDYYDFVIGFQKEYFPKNPIFSGPSANVLTNISPKEKAVGFFAAYSVVRKSTIYKKRNKKYD